MPHSSFCINPIQLIGGSLRLHKHVRGADSFISKCLLVFLCVAMMLGQAASVELSPDAKERSHEVCSNHNLFAVEDISDDLISGSLAVKVSLKESIPDAVQQTVILHGERLPSTCGGHFSRCNIIFVTNPIQSSSNISVLLVPLRRGVAQIVYTVDIENGTLQMISYNVLELPHQISTCQITALFDLTKLTTPPIHFIHTGSFIPQAVALCLSEIDPVDVRLINVSIDFNNVSRSSLSPLTNQVFARLSSPEVVSNFVFLSDLPRCLSEHFNSLTYYFENSHVGLFDVVSEDLSQAEQYTLFYDGTRREFICSSPRQLVRVSDKVLVIYCNDSSAEVDMCLFTSSTAQNTNIHKLADGIPYFCSEDMKTFVTLSGKTVSFNSSLSVVNYSLPLVANEDVYIGNCIQGKDGDVDILYFAATSSLGNTYIVSLGEDDREDERTTVLEERSVDDSLSFVQHQIYERELIVYNNGSCTILLNASCHNPTTIDHKHHLSLVIPATGHYPCTCPIRASDTKLCDGTECVPSREEDSATNRTPTNTIYIVIAATVVPFVTIIVAVLVVFLKKTKVQRLRFCHHEDSELQSQIELHAFPQHPGLLTLNDPSICSSSPADSTRTAVHLSQSDLSPSIESTDTSTLPGDSNNLLDGSPEGSSVSSSSGGSEATIRTESYSRQEQNGKNSSSTVLPLSSNGTQVYKSNDISTRGMQQQSRADDDNDQGEREVGSPGSNGGSESRSIATNYLRSNYAATMEYYRNGAPTTCNVIPVEESTPNIQQQRHENCL